ncbi:MAG: HD domain-containing protein [Clostridiales bacterium]|nr:HD domain-containing protein [Clostridiales bacterium]
MSKILVIDDEKMITDTLSTLIEMVLDYEVITMNDPELLLNSDLLEKESFDMVISDFMMPKIDGIDVLKAIKKIQPNAIPILLTGYSDKNNAIKSINEVGLYYYLEKPWDNDQLITIIKNGIEKKQLKEQVDKNFVIIKKRNEEITRLYDLLQKDFNSELDSMYNVIISLANIVEAKDSYTEGHTRRVSELSRMIASNMNFDEKGLRNIELAGIVHDIGKVSTPDQILNKPGRLSNEEFDIIKEHPEIGERILKPLTSMNSILHPVRHHHEKLDGTGYPDGLKGDEIILESRILAVADIFDALYTDRPYKTKFTIEKTLEILKEEASANKIDSDVVDIVSNLIENEHIFDIYKREQTLKDTVNNM